MKPGEWARWALRMAELHGLNDGEARVLAALAAHANGAGEVHVLEGTIAKAAGRKGRTVRTILASLSRRGLVTTHQQGQKRAKRVLHDVLPVEQLALDVTGRPAARPPGRPADSCALQPGRLGGLQKGIEGRTKEEERAREQTAAVSELATTLSKVRDILDPAPGVVVEPLSVNSMLLGMPESKGYDHELAAHTVAAWAHEGGLRVPSASRLMQQALLKQAERKDRIFTPFAGARRPDRERRPAPEDEWDAALIRSVRGRTTSS